MATTVTIDFQGLLKSAFFAYLSGAPVRIGWERDFLKESVSRFFYTEVVTPKRIHIIDQQMELLQPLGIDPNWDTEVPLRAPPAARRKSRGEKASGAHRLRYLSIPAETGRPNVGIRNDTVNWRAA